MLRALIAVLLVANLAFFAWSRGWLDGAVGARAIGDREPERMQHQFRPELVQILPPEAAASAALRAAPTCFEAGPFAEAEVGAAQTAVQATLPAGSWSTVRTDQPGAWIVFLGRYPEGEERKRREEDLKRRQVPYEEVAEPPALAPGLSLGRFDRRPAAEQALAQLAQQGIRNARVVELAPATSRTVLRVERADPALGARIAGLRPDAVAGKGFTACARQPGV